MPKTIQSIMMRGALWMVLFKFMDRSLGFVSTLFLVRLLSPADFGIVAMGLTFVFMAEVLGSFGFDIALIQHRAPTDEHFHSAWTCNVLLGCTTTVVLLLLAAPVATFYAQPEVMWVLVALAFGPLFASLENIGTVKFRRDLQFRKEFTFRASRRLIAFAVTLPLAFWLRNYWALVAGILISKLGGSILSYVAQDFRPRFCLTKVKELFQFSKWLLFNSIAFFVRDRCTDFFVGRLYGPAALGIYNISYEVANMPTVELSASINRALLPSFAKIDDKQELRSTYQNTMSVLALVALPAAAGIFAVAPFLVPVVLGPKWLDSTALIEILAFNGALLLFQSSICSVVTSRGFPQQVAKANGLYVIVLIGLLGLMASRWGVIGAAWAVLMTAILMTPAYLYLMNRQLGVGPSVFLRATVRPVFAAIAMAAIVRWFLPAYTTQMSVTQTVGWLAAGIAIGIVVFIVCVAVLWHLAGKPASAEGLVLDRARKLLARKGPA